MGKLDDEDDDFSAGDDAEEEEVYEEDDDAAKKTGGRRISGDSVKEPKAKAKKPVAKPAPGSSKEPKPKTVKVPGPRKPSAKSTASGSTTTRATGEAVTSFVPPSLGSPGGSDAGTDVDMDMDAAIVEEDGPDQALRPHGTSGRPTNRPQTVEQIYQKKSQLEHILLRPDSYIGSTEPIVQSMWVWDHETSHMVNRPITYVPGLFKIFDELIVNAADNKMRDATMSAIRVTINRAQNQITVRNNGKGIPVVVHKGENVYVPELIFGHLLTSSNYDDEERKMTGGRNGYGAKLCNIFSTLFEVETTDRETGLRFRQTFRNNMSERSTPKVTAYTNKTDDYTQIMFSPDLKRFGLQELHEDMELLLTKRVYDLAGSVRDVRVYLNDEQIKIKTFRQYAALYLDAETEKRVVYERAGDRWEVCFVPHDGQFQQVSFVNSICTTRGGSHVTHVTDQLVENLLEAVRRKNKTAPIKAFQVKNCMWMFINSLIENPAFDSQTKETLTSRVSAFGSRCVLSPEFMKRVARSGVVEQMLDFARSRQDQLLKKTDGHKRTRLSGISKLDDANNSGTRHAGLCTLILTEGDSAKALAVSGLSVVGRDNYGVFPLRGKLLNVREASHKQIMENQEVNHIKQILGLQHGKIYETAETLRYGHLMIMTDQDHDGSHIKGLLINLIDHFWPSLLRVPSFMLEFVTPIVKATRGRQERSFFTIPEYAAWRLAEAESHLWTIKYYKGLGTSTAADARKYFSDMGLHMKRFAPIQSDETALIEMAFSKKRADSRKEWLRTFEAGTFIDHSAPEITYGDFINKELILFSMADNVRSIPSVVDGLKPGHRKIIFGCFKRRLRGEIKVAQLVGYVSEHSSYHHGEQSLSSTIVGLAQDFCGANNVNLLQPIGQFGTRLQGGKDAASARYIFTALSRFARLVFHPDDDGILTYLNDDGQSIEPEHYVPILPMVLVNGGEGIGTGWSSSIPNFNAADVIRCLRAKMDDLPMPPLHPWYRHFGGSIEPLDETCSRYRVTGVLRRVDDTTIEVTELPVGLWTQTYKEMLETWTNGTDTQPATISDFKEYHTENRVHFVIRLTPPQMAAAESEGLEKRLRLSTTLSMTNLVCFDARGHIHKYTDAHDIINAFYDVRLHYYRLRKAHLLERLQGEQDRLMNKVRFILEIIDGVLVVQKVSRRAVLAMLAERGYKAFGNSAKEIDVENAENAENENDGGDGAKTKADASGYNYLLSMQIWTLTLERVEQLKAELAAKTADLERIMATDPKDIWRADMDAFMAALEVHNEPLVETSAHGKARVKGGKAAARRKNDDGVFGAVDGMDDDFVPNVSVKNGAGGAVRCARVSPAKEKKTTTKKKDEEMMLVTDLTKMQLERGKKNEDVAEVVSESSAKTSDTRPASRLVGKYLTTKGANGSGGTQLAAGSKTTADISIDVSQQQQDKGSTVSIIQAAPKAVPPRKRGVGKNAGSPASQPLAKKAASMGEQNARGRSAVTTKDSPISVSSADVLSLGDDDTGEDVSAPGSAVTSTGVSPASSTLSTPRKQPARTTRAKAQIVISDTESEESLAYSGDGFEDDD